MHRHICVVAFAILWVAALSAKAPAATPWAFRPPAVPLIAHHPYFSVWSQADRLTDDWPRHWTGAAHAMWGALRIDGNTYRFLGAEPSGKFKVPPMEQTDLKIWPTRTVASFTAAGVQLTLTFCSPLLPSDIEVLSRPVTYVTCEMKSSDGKEHDVSLYFDACSEMAVQDTGQIVMFDRENAGGLKTLRVGTKAQPILGRVGDQVRIDWGWLYFAAPTDGKPMITTADGAVARSAFVQNQPLPDKPIRDPQVVNHGYPVLGCAYDLGKISGEAQSRHFLIAYDESEAAEYLGQPLRPYWRIKFTEPRELLEQAERDYIRLSNTARSFDEKLVADLTQAGGEKYAALATLCYREAIAGHGLAASADGRPFMFAKENSSNGCMGTVDVIYPAAPIFLLLSPQLMEANLAPVVEYAASPRWKFNFAPHDLGTYPLANGQVYGGGERTEEDQMPVEESANMLILIAAMEKATEVPSKMGEKHQAVLRKWADYLVEKGLDPENQLCTDDFTGHLAHNVNLSAKAILGIAAFGQICENHEDKDLGKQYLDKARDMAKQWVTMAVDGDHTKLAFDKTGTWSQKYNLVWDKVLGLNLFPADVAKKEVAFYKGKLNKYGPPLDNRAGFTKLDWTVWSACLADDPKDFAALVDPLYAMANETPDRVPLTDWYETDSGKHDNFIARPVVGGVYMKMLCDPAMWKKWSRPIK